MNVNVKITLTDEQRNTFYRNMTGDDVKRMVSRKEINTLVQDYIQSMLKPQQPSAPVKDGRNQVPMHRPSPPPFIESDHDDCCHANQLLRTRVNTLQHQLDTRK